MTVSEAIDSRISVRAYTDEPVPRETVERILAAAGRSPSGGNLQPWQVYVLMDEALAAFKAGLAERQRGKPFGETPLFHVYPPKLHEPYRTRRFECGEDLYATLGIPREDKAGRMRQFAGNFDFFGAPVALFFAIDKRMDRNQWAHLGMFMQSVMLLAREAGLDTCPQECWAIWPSYVAEFVGMDEALMPYCGMALGHRDPDAPVNALRTRRAPLADYARFVEVPA